MVNAQDDQITVLSPTYDEKATTEAVGTSEVEASTIESIDDRVEPTDEELATLRRISETIPLRAWQFFHLEILTQGSLLSWNYANVSPITDVKAYGAIISRTLSMIRERLECLAWDRKEL